MDKEVKNNLSKYAGVVLASMYGIVFRILLDNDIDLVFEGLVLTDLFSTTFVVVVPFVIGIIPMFFASNAQLHSTAYRALMPLLSVLIFFFICYLSGLEGIICLVVIFVPYGLVAMLGGVVFGWIIRAAREKRKTITPVLLLPLLTGVVEERIPTPTKVHDVATTVIINASANEIWQNIVRVDNIAESEYNKGFFNYAGMPRPLYAELDKDTVGATRVGHFENGLMFVERVTDWQKNKKVSFSIEVVPESVGGNTVFEQHVLTSARFKFLNASYELKELGADKTELVLHSSYRLHTKVNAYGIYWGDKMVGDFQERLLEVIKQRCE